MRPFTLAGLIALAGLLALALLGLFAGLAAGSQPTPPAAAADAPILVTTTLDELTPDGNCSLREAIQAANTRTAVDACGGAPGFDEILLPSGTYSLTLAGAKEDANAAGDLDITGTLTLRNRDAIRPVINGNGKDRVLHVRAGGVVTITGVVITGGRAPDGGPHATPPSSSPGESGGGILNEGALTLIDVAVSFNSAGRGGMGDGGGIANTGSLVLIRAEVLGNAAGGSSLGQIGRAGYGGGIANSGAATVTWSTIANNTTQNDGAWPFYGPWGDGGGGGGIYNSGTLTLDRSLVSGNATSIGGDDETSCGDGGPGGGIYNEKTLRITNSTVSGNATGDGGMFCYNLGGDGAGIANAGSLIVENATITANGAGRDSGTIPLPWRGGEGGGISGSATIRNTILAGNTSPQGPQDCTGPLTLAGYNLVQDTRKCVALVTGPGNLFGFDARLQPLADNGGPTRTHALGPTSPAIDRGSCTDSSGGAVTADQRGVARPSGRTCDIGAFESSYERVGLKMYVPFAPR